MSEQDLFEVFVNKLHFDVSEYLDSELSEKQNKMIEDATFILQDNTIGEIKKFGGNLQKNKEKFENFLRKAEDELEKDDYKEEKKELNQFFKDYTKKLQQFIAKTVVAIIPVKELPWIDIIFRSVPRITIDNKKLNLIDDAIAYYGEIKCLISRATIYGKIKDEKPLFAPFMGELDLKGYKIDDSDKNKAKSLVYPYVSAIIISLDSSTTRSQLGKYHEGYQRHGEPICDFLMNKKDLLESMEKIHTGLDSNRIASDISVCGIALPLASDKTSFVLVTDESKDSQKYSKCFEAILRFSAACCEAPSTLKGLSLEQTSQTAQQQIGVMRTPGGQELKVWTPEELAEEARKRGGGIPSGMETWSEEDLQKFAEERGSGIPEGMETWTEEELIELAKKRQGGLDIPEWKPDEDLIACEKCGYSLRKGWSECPICNTPVDAKDSKEKVSSSEKETEQSEQPNQPDTSNQPDTDTSDDISE